MLCATSDSMPRPYGDPSRSSPRRYPRNCRSSLWTRRSSWGRLRRRCLIPSRSSYRLASKYRMRSGGIRAPRDRLAAGTQSLPGRARRTKEPVAPSPARPSTDRYADGARKRTDRAPSPPAIARNAGELRVHRTPNRGRLQGVQRQPTSGPGTRSRGCRGAASRSCALQPGERRTRTDHRVDFTPRAPPVRETPIHRTRERCRSPGA